MSVPTQPIMEYVCNTNISSKKDDALNDLLFRPWTQVASQIRRHSVIDKVRAKEKGIIMGKEVNLGLRFDSLMNMGRDDMVVENKELNLGNSNNKIFSKNVTITRPSMRNVWTKFKGKENVGSQQGREIERSSQVDRANRKGLFGGQVEKQNSIIIEKSNASLGLPHIEVSINESRIE
ncbi:hypothetical protein PVK06_001302 [Gossypium arboreum]|uniref:Uncharacterized protein n=1 Tax=Gossypium arboreum TaxID=29729 RepID=A0ABR0R1N1_GOSAR|nr:hypothetical protein PVK06_001302 [Gossypium arboreum]